MDSVDSVLAAVLKEMGVNPNKPARWLPHFYRAIDRTTGEVFREYPDGFICSRCGKHSCAKDKKCSGCNSEMQKGENNGT